MIDPDPAGIARLTGELEAAGLHVDPSAALRALGDRTQFNAIDGATGWKVDFLVRKDRAFSRQEFARRIRADLLGTTAWLASPEDTIIAKLEWAMASGSDLQLGDVAGVLDVGGDSLDLVYVGRWVADLGLEAPWHRAQLLRAVG